jgi:hypothetical protein
MNYSEARRLNADVTARAFVAAVRHLEERGIETHHAVIAGSLGWLDEGVVITILVVGNGEEKRYRRVIGAAVLESISESDISELQAVYQERRVAEDYAAYARVVKFEEGDMEW